MTLIEDVYAEMKKAIGPIDPDGFERAIRKVRLIWAESIESGWYPYANLDGTVGLYPLVDNPNLEEWMSRREVRVRCSNDHQYIFFQEIVQGEVGTTGVRDLSDEEIFCPDCGESIAQAKSYAMHSAGHFNLVMHRGG